MPRRRSTATWPHTAPTDDREALAEVERLLLALVDDREPSGEVRWQLECLALELRARLGCGTGESAGGRSRLAAGGPRCFT